MNSATKRYHEARDAWLEEMVEKRSPCFGGRVRPVILVEKGKYAFGEGWHLHHITSRSRRPDLIDDKGNFACVCETLHSMVGNEKGDTTDMLEDICWQCRRGAS